MNQFSENKEEKDLVVSCLNRVLDDIYDLRDALNQAGITSETDTKLKSMETVAEDYEKLRRKVLDDEELESVDIQSIKLCMAKIIREWEMQVIKINKARKELIEFSQKL